MQEETRRPRRMKRKKASKNTKGKKHFLSHFPASLLIFSLGGTKQLFCLSFCIWLIIIGIVTWRKGKEEIDPFHRGANICFVDRKKIIRSLISFIKRLHT